MRIVTQLLGDGTAADPWRAPFPTYELVDFDRETKLAHIEVPAELIPYDLPAGAATELRAEPAENEIKGDLLPLVPLGEHEPAFHAALHEFLDETYPEHSGEFRPIIHG